MKILAVATIQKKLVASKETSQPRTRQQNRDINNTAIFRSVHLGESQTKHKYIEIENYLAMKYWYANCCYKPYYGYSTK